MSKENYITKEGYRKLKRELKYLREIARHDVATKIKEARDMGDVSENSVYDAALDEQGYVEGRIAELEELLSNSTIIKNTHKGEKIVAIGSTVVVEIEGKKDTFTVVGSAEADPVKRFISNESPVGKALLGAKLGDVIEVKTPVFKAIYKIIDVK